MFNLAPCNMVINMEARKERKLSRYMKAPIRILIKVRDFYIRSMTECSARLDYGTAFGCPTPQISPLPRSFSTNSAKSSSNEDFRELVRAASTRSLRNKAKSDLLPKKQVSNSPVAAANHMPRSRSVAIGRIDEDSPCEFEEDIKVNTDGYPRSRSYAVSRRRTRVF